MDFYTVFLGYLAADLVTSGMDEEDLEKLNSPGMDLKEKWEIFFPYWNLAKNTHYSKSALIFVKDLFGIEVIDHKATVEITEKLKESNKTDYYHKILKKKCNIGYILNDLDPLRGKGIIKQIEPDKDYFLPILRADELIMINSKRDLEKIEKQENISIYSFHDYIDYTDSVFEKRPKIYGVKIGIAYGRDIKFLDVSKQQAEESFGKLLNIKKYGWHRTREKDNISIEELRDFQDYMYHYCIKKAIQYDLPAQIHTGIHAGVENDIRNSNPTLLTDVILKYKKAKFDLFHTGYPFADELICMVKTSKNCYFNMCWMSTISRLLYKNILNLAIEMLPSNKIFGFGGDNVRIEGSYAAIKIARETIAEVLCSRIKEGYFDFRQAIEFAERILAKNPEEVYLKWKSGR